MRVFMIQILRLGDKLEEISFQLVPKVCVRRRSRDRRTTFGEDGNQEGGFVSYEMLHRHHLVVLDAGRERCHGGCSHRKPSHVKRAGHSVYVSAERSTDDPSIATLLRRTGGVLTVRR